jgi:hypothetical protein
MSYPKLKWQKVCLNKKEIIANRIVSEQNILVVAPGFQVSGKRRMHVLDGWIEIFSVTLG